MPRWVTIKAMVAWRRRGSCLVQRLRWALLWNLVVRLSWNGMLPRGGMFLRYATTGTIVIRGTSWDGASAIVPSRYGTSTSIVGWSSRYWSTRIIIGSPFGYRTSAVSVGRSSWYRIIVGWFPWNGRRRRRLSRYGTRWGPAWNRSGWWWLRWSIGRSLSRNGSTVEGRGRWTPPWRPLLGNARVHGIAAALRSGFGSLLLGNVPTRLIISTIHGWIFLLLSLEIRYTKRKWRELHSETSSRCLLFATYLVVSYKQGRLFSKAPTHLWKILPPNSTAIKSQAALSNQMPMTSCNGPEDVSMEWLCYASKLMDDDGVGITLWIAVEICFIGWVENLHTCRPRIFPMVKPSKLSKSWICTGIGLIRVIVDSVDSISSLRSKRLQDERWLFSFQYVWQSSHLEWYKTVLFPIQSFTKQKRW